MNQDKIWEQYQNDSEFSNIGCRGGGRHELVAKHVHCGATALNIGVGRGDLEQLLVQKGVVVSCLDPSSTSIERLRQTLQLGERAKVGYSQEIPFQESAFDFVIMSEVLEHLDDVVLDETIKEVERVLKFGGKFIGTVPADENLSTSITICPHCENSFHRWGHEQTFSTKGLTGVLNQHFGCVEVKRVYPIDFTQLNWKGKIVGLFKKIQAGSGMKGGNQNFYFEALKD